MQFWYSIFHSWFLKCISYMKRVKCVIMHVNLYTKVQYLDGIFHERTIAFFDSDNNGIMKMIISHNNICPGYSFSEHVFFFFLYLLSVCLFTSMPLYGPPAMWWIFLKFISFLFILSILIMALPFCFMAVSTTSVNKRHRKLMLNLEQLL